MDKLMEIMCKNMMKVFPNANSKPLTQEQLLKVQSDSFKETLSLPKDQWPDDMREDYEVIENAIREGIKGRKKYETKTISKDEGK